jgi:flagellar basal body-associated protein FliL
MSKAKIVVVLLAILILVLSVSISACGFTSQGSQEQNRPAENQNPAEEDKTEPILKTPEKSMEEAGKEEATQK